MPSRWQRMKDKMTKGMEASSSGAASRADLGPAETPADPGAAETPTKKLNFPTVVHRIVFAWEPAEDIKEEISKMEVPDVKLQVALGDHRSVLQVLTSRTRIEVERDFVEMARNEKPHVTIDAYTEATEQKTSEIVKALGQKLEGLLNEKIEGMVEEKIKANEDSNAAPAPKP